MRNLDLRHDRRASDIILSIGHSSGLAAPDMTLIMVEHDMSVVFGLAEIVTVLVYGQIIASDVPARIRTNPAVQEAYLGTKAT